MPPQILRPRKMLLTMHDFIKKRLNDNGWEHVHIIDMKDGWPEDRALVIVEDGATAPEGKTPVPCLKMSMTNTSDRGDVQIGGGLTEDEYFFDVQFQCRSQGEEMDLREFIRISLEDSVIYLLDWIKYPQVPQPDSLVLITLHGVSSLPIYDISNPNIALRWAGMISWTVSAPRNRTIISNV